MSDDRYRIVYSYQDPEEYDGYPPEQEKVVVTVEGDVDAAVSFWGEDFGVFVIGFHRLPHPGKPQFHLSPTEWSEYC